MKYNTMNWRCSVCAAHDMNEDIAFSHAERLQHRVMYQTSEDTFMLTTLRKPYTAEEKAELVLRGEMKFRQHIIGDMAAHRSDCKCMDCFYTAYPEFKPAEEA